MFYVEFDSPIWVIDDIIYYIRYQECIAIFLGRVFDRQVSFLEIARNKEKCGKNDRCQVLQIEGVFLLG
jgi:hypothetical protein